MENKFLSSPVISFTIQKADKPFNKLLFIREYERVNRRFEVLFFPRTKKAIHSLVKEVISSLNDGGFDAARNYLSTVVANPEMTKTVKLLYQTVGRKHAQMNYSRLKAQRMQKGFGFNKVWTDFILNYLNQFLLEKVMINIAHTTRDALLKVLTTATIAGWSIDKTVDYLEDWPFERFQAARIVRTETNRAANVGAKAQAETDEYQQVKEWISAQDYRVRGHNPKDHASHVELNGTTIDDDDFFKDSRNGDLLEFPGDPKASAASTINCRCAVAYTYKRDIDGNLIPKRKSTVVLHPGTIRRPRTITI